MIQSLMYINFDTSINHIIDTKIHFWEFLLFLLPAASGLCDQKNAKNIM